MTRGGIGELMMLGSGLARSRLRCDRARPDPGTRAAALVRATAAPQSHELFPPQGCAYPFFTFSSPRSVTALSFLPTRSLRFFPGLNAGTTFAGTVIRRWVCGLMR